MLAFDSTILSLLLFEDAELHQGPDGSTVEYARDRVLGLLQEIEEAKEVVLIPTPALAEVLVNESVDDQMVLTRLRESAHLRIAGFDERAAVELAFRLRKARAAGDMREGLKITKAAMKFDRQIVAIALVNRAAILYSDDAGVAAFAAGCGLKVVGVAELPLPPRQNELPFADE
jgi:hypothetical protein